MKKIIYIFLLLLVLINGCDITSEDYTASAIPDEMLIDGYVDEKDMEFFLSNKFTNADVAAKLFYQDELIYAKLEPQGAGSRFFPKWSFTVACADSQKILNLSKFNLSSQVYDKTMMRTALATKIYGGLGFKTFFSTHAFLRINNTDRGLYALIERIEEEYFEKRGEPYYELMKTSFDAKFTFREGKFQPSNHFEKKLPDDENYTNLIEFINALDNCDSSNVIERISPYLDIENYLTYHAATYAMNNSDAFANNFYLFKETPSSPYCIIPWDFDKSFYYQFDVKYPGYNNIISKLLQNSRLKKEFNDKLYYIVENVMTGEKLFPVIDSIYSKIKESYMLDPHLGGSGYSLETEKNNIKNFIIDRRLKILEELENRN